jgi:hypothetical protein
MPSAIEKLISPALLGRLPQSFLKALTPRTTCEKLGSKAA